MEGEVIGELEGMLHGEHFTVVQHLGRWGGGEVERDELGSPAGV